MKQTLLLMHCFIRSAITKSSIKLETLNSKYS
jgi:hypothetical protein